MQHAAVGAYEKLQAISYKLQATSRERLANHYSEKKE